MGRDYSSPQSLLHRSTDSPKPSHMLTINYLRIRLSYRIALLCCTTQLHTLPNRVTRGPCHPETNFLHPSAKRAGCGMSFGAGATASRMTALISAAASVLSADRST